MSKHVSAKKPALNSAQIKRSLFLPFLILWLEGVLHIFSGGSPRYGLIAVLFSLSLGFFLDGAAFLFKGKFSKVLTDIFTAACTLIYMAEYIARNLLQTFYPASTLGTAVDNKLFQFWDVILLTIVKRVYVLALMLIPLFFVFHFRKREKEFIKNFGRSHLKGIAAYMARKDKGEAGPRAAAAVLLLALLFHIAGLGAVYFIPWGGSMNPKELYESDTDFNYQVETLGLYSFLRLDIKHTIFPNSAAGGLDMSDDFEDETVPSEDEKEEQTKEPEENLPDTSPNVLSVDLPALLAGTDNKEIKWLCEYFENVPATNKNEYTGMFKNYNVVFITVEALDISAVSEKYTPTLYKMQHEGFFFKNFYTALHYTSTSNGECQNLLGLYPKNGNPITMTRTGELGTNCYFSLAQQLGRKGYANFGYHNNWDLYGRACSHSNLGYYWQYSYHGLTGELKPNGDLQWPQKDTIMMDESLPDYANSDKPFNVYYMTVSGHMPYGWNWATAAYKEDLEELEYSKPAKGYIASVMECDRAVKKIVDALAASGKLEKTVFVIVPDHIPYSAVEILEELTGKKLGKSSDVRAINERDIDFDIYRNYLAIWSASMEKPVEVDKVCCQVDILPTLSNLMGLEYDSRMLSGSDILSDSEGLVVFSSRSWKSDRGFYNRFTKVFSPAEGVSMSEDEKNAYVESMIKTVSRKLSLSEKIVENNFYDYAFGGRAERIRGEIAPKNQER